MAKSHPAQLDQQDAPHLAPWARNTVASFTLLACLVSLNVILHNRHGVRVVSSIGNSVAALDLVQLVNLADAPAKPPVADGPNAGKFRAVGDYLARRYRVSSEMTTTVVTTAHAIGAELKLDPLLILAVIAVESRFNPLAESGMGAKGLMQVIPRYHSDKFDPLGGEKVAFDPQANIVVGAKILKEYLRRTGDIADALQLYVGATSDENENGYSGKVMAERDRLGQVLRQFETQNRTAQHQPAGRPLAASI
jgi:soluble lytic murein transglycosylase-like protein